MKITNEADEYVMMFTGRRQDRMDMYIGYAWLACRDVVGSAIPS